MSPNRPTAGGGFIPNIHSGQLHTFTSSVFRCTFGGIAVFTLVGRICLSISGATTADHATVRLKHKQHKNATPDLCRLPTSNFCRYSYPHTGIWLPMPIYFNTENRAFSSLCYFSFNTHLQFTFNRFSVALHITAHTCWIVDRHWHCVCTELLPVWQSDAVPCRGNIVRRFDRRESANHFSKIQYRRIRRYTNLRI